MENQVTMRVVNNLSKPGDIRRVDLNPDTVRVQLHGGQDIIYRVTEMKNITKENNNDNIQ